MTTLRALEARVDGDLRNPQTRLAAMQQVADTIRNLLDTGRFRYVDVANGGPEIFAPSCRMVLTHRSPGAARSPDVAHNWLDASPRVLIRCSRDVVASAGKVYSPNPHTSGPKVAISADVFAHKRFVSYKAGRVYAVPVGVAVHLEPRLIGSDRVARAVQSKSAGRCLGWVAGSSGPAVLCLGFEWQGTRHTTATEQEIETARAWGEWSERYRAAGDAKAEVDLSHAFVRDHGNRLSLVQDAPGELTDEPASDPAPEPVQPRRGRAAA